MYLDTGGGEGQHPICASSLFHHDFLDTRIKIRKKLFQQKCPPPQTPNKGSTPNHNCDILYNMFY